MAGFGTSLVIEDWDFQRKMTEIERRQVPFAASVALNDTAQDILRDVQDRMNVVFDRPTRFTKNAFMVWRANKRTLEAMVQERPSVGSKHYLKVEETGGARPKTGMERMVSGSLGSMFDGVAVVPAQGARINAFGNWSAGDRNKALGAVKALGAGGSAKAGARGAYFVPKKRAALSPGIWKRTGKGRREKLSKVAHFTARRPFYTSRLGFLDGAADVFDRRFAPNFRRAFERALETAR